MNRKRAATGGGIVFFLALFGMACTTLGALVQHLPFQDALGNPTLAKATGGNATKLAGNIGYYTNNVPPGIRSSWAWYAAAQGTANDAYIQLSGYSNPLDLGDAGKAISILAWIKLDVLGLTGVQGIVSHRRNGGSGWMFYAQNKTLRFQMRGTDTTQYTLTTAADTITEGEWTHVALTWTAGSGSGSGALKLYINGESKPVTGTIPVGMVAVKDSTSCFLRACVSQSNGGLQLRGAIDDIRLYDEVLTEEQIVLIMKPPNGTVITIR